MSKSIARSLAVGFLCAAFGQGLAAQAVVEGAGDGTWRTGVCETATSQFIQLTGKQATLGFGGTSEAGQMVNAGVGTAGLRVNFNYTAQNPTTSNDFRSIQFNYNPGGDAGKKNTSIRYCFQTEHGTGSKTVTYETTLNKLSSSSIGNGFQQASQNSMQFGGLNVRNMVLRRITFTVGAAGWSANNTIGDLQLTVNGGLVEPIGVNLTPGTCNTLFTCPPDEDAVD